MTSREAARRLREIATLLEDLGPDGSVPVLGGAHDQIGDTRTVILRISMKETKRHVVTADRMLRIAHEAELESDHAQGVLPL